MSSLNSQAIKDKESMEEKYQKALEVIFAYGYRCCLFKHNIYGNHPEALEGMLDSANPLPPNFFVNPGCPLVHAAVEATTTKAPPSEMAKEPVEVATTEDQSRL